MKNALCGSLAILLLAALAVPGALAQESYNQPGFRGWGPRLGATVDPDQVHFGLHVDVGNFAEHIRFEPNFELGFGDNVTLAAINFDALYRFASNWDVWSPYLGGGLGVNTYSFDIEGVGNHSETELGVNLIGGIERGLASGDRFFIVGKIGLADAPDFKVTVGWTFLN